MSKGNMRARAALAAAAAIAAVITVVACVSDSGTVVNSNQPGGKGGPCYDNGTCDQGLTCVSAVCVPGEGGVAGGSDASGPSNDGGGSTTDGGGASDAGTDSATGCAQNVTPDILAEIACGELLDGSCDNNTGDLFCCNYPGDPKSECVGPASAYQCDYAFGCTGNDCSAGSACFARNAIIIDAGCPRSLMRDLDAATGLSALSNCAQLDSGVGIQLCATDMGCANIDGGVCTRASYGNRIFGVCEQP